MKIRPKQQFILLSWATLLLFSGLGVFLLWFFNDADILSIFEWNHFFNPINLIGLEFGLLYGFLVIIISQAPLFDDLSNQQSYIIKSMKLNWREMTFASFCAGFGEEILFRAGIQTWLGPIITSILFIAVHGYIHPLSWRKSMLSVLLFPFIILIAYAYYSFGLWFCIAAHFAYDLIMFIATTKEEN